MLILQPYKTQKHYWKIIYYYTYTRNFIGYESFASSEICLRDVEAIFCQIQDEKILSTNSKNEYKMDNLKVLAYPVDRNHYSSLVFPSVIRPLWPLKGVYTPLLKFPKKNTLTLYEKPLWCVLRVENSFTGFFGVKNKTTLVETKFLR